MDIQQQALFLASQGLLVFPCFIRDKGPATRNGLYDATDDVDLIKKRFLWDFRLIGVPTGAITGITILDIDPRHGGHIWALENLHKLPRTRAHQTRSGGYHLLFRHPGYPVSGSAGRIAPGIDVRGDGNYCIWWPCHGYQVINNDGMDCELPIWPDWLKPPEPKPRAKQPQQATNGKVSRAMLFGLLDTVIDAKPGSRNSCLYWAGCRLGEKAGLSEEDAVAMLVAAAALAGLDAYEAEKTARSGFNKGRGY